MHRQRGFSLVEMMVATAATAVMALGILGVVQSSSAAVRLNASQLDSHNKTARTFQGIERLVRASSLATYQTIPDGFETLQPVADGVPMDDLWFQSLEAPGGDPDALPALSVQLGLYLMASPSDPVNGLDDDRNGVVDGRILVLDRAGQLQTLMTEVTSWTAVLSGSALTLTVDVASRIPDGGARVERQSRTLEIRND